MKIRHTLIRCLLLISLILPPAISSAQQPVNRAASTVIVDALNQLPARNQELYTRLMEDIVSTGEEGVNMLIITLEKKDAGMIPAEYALDGLAAYASAESFDPTKREIIKNAFQDAYDRILNMPEPDGDLRGFYEKQLRRLGAVTSSNTWENTFTTFAAKAVSPKEAEKSMQKLAKKTVREFAAMDRKSGFGVLNAISKAPSHSKEHYCRAFTEALPKFSPETVRDILWWFGENRDISNENTLLKYLDTDDKETFSTAAWALVKIKSEAGMKKLSSLLTSDDDRIVGICEKCLRSAGGPVAEEAAKYYGEATSAGKAAILNLVAQRNSLENRALVFNALASDDAGISDAAYAALKNVVSYTDLNTLYGILETCDASHLSQAGDAVLSALSSQDAMTRNNILVSRRNSAEAEVKDRYVPIIIKTADMEQLYDLCGEYGSKPGLFEMAFSRLADMIGEADIPGAQSLLLYRRAMSLAGTDAQRCRILSGIGDTGEFLGIIFAGQYIEEPALQQTAARAVMKIALGHPEYYGIEITALLNRVAEVLEGPDSEYEITAVRKHLSEIPVSDGFVSMFDGATLNGWKGLVKDPVARGKMTPKAMAQAQKEADKRMRENWKVEDGCIVYEGKGFDNLCTAKNYGDFEMYVDWMLDPSGAEPDAGIYLRGTPQVQIWDIARTDVGAQVGSGGLYNNGKNPSTPSSVADNRLGQWNSFYIKMVGERVTVLLNGVKVVDNVILENYWDRNSPVPMADQIELQAHGSRVAFRNLYIRELPQTTPVELSAEEKKEGFELLFDGTSMHRFKGNFIDYSTQEGTIHVLPTGQGFGNLYVDGEYSDFIYRFEFKLTEGANNGIGIRCEEGKDAAYYGMEIQILDHYNPIYQPWLKDYQYHGSVYGIIPAKTTDALKPVGEWNCEEIYVKGDYIRVTVNGVVINDGNIREATANGTYDGKEHPGLFNKSGRIGFLGHGSELWFRNIRIKKL